MSASTQLDQLKQFPTVVADTDNVQCNTSTVTEGRVMYFVHPR